MFREMQIIVRSGNVYSAPKDNPISESNDYFH